MYAYIPLDDQTALGGRSIRTFYVGFAQGHKGGILLYNPKTKRTIVRRSFKIMGPIDQSNSNIILECLEHKDDDQETILDPIDVPLTNKEVVYDLPAALKSTPLSKNKILVEDVSDGEEEIITSESVRRIVPLKSTPLDRTIPPLVGDESDDENDYAVNDDITINKDDDRFGNDTVLDHDPLVRPYVRNIPKVDAKNV